MGCNTWFGLIPGLETDAAYRVGYTFRGNLRLDTWGNLSPKLEVENLLRWRTSVMRLDTWGKSQ